MQLLSPFYRLGNWGLEHVSNLAKVRILAYGGARMTASYKPRESSSLESAETSTNRQLWNTGGLCQGEAITGNQRVNVTRSTDKHTLKNLKKEIEKDSCGGVGLLREVFWSCCCYFIFIWGGESTGHWTYFWPNRKCLAKSADLGVGKDRSSRKYLIKGNQILQVPFLLSPESSGSKARSWNSDIPPFVMKHCSSYNKNANSLIPISTFKWEGSTHV